jgi:hypothetical protein
MLAVLLSIALHFLLALLPFPREAALNRLHRIPGAAEQIITISNAPTFAKRLAPPPSPHRTVTLPTPPQPAVVPKAVEHVAQVPSIQAPRRGVAINVHAPKTTSVRAGGATSGLSETQVASMERDFAQTIDASRPSSDLLAGVPTASPAASKHYTMELAGIHDDLTRGEGILTPTQSWQSDGYTYYYVNYEIAFEDGTYDSGSVPWPIRYHPRDDPFTRNTRDFPLPGPLPGYVLPPGTVLGRALRGYFPTLYPDG